MEIEFPIHHVIVIGFHHKKGCQIEFAYPPFDVDIENTAWKHLATLAMPDGAHNFTTDTVYFHLPSLKKAGDTVFGVACYQQIDASKIKNKSDEVTRSTIQKSVCVLSKYPLYGHIQVKMSLITAAYFREGDFGQVSILEEAYHNLNACLSPNLLNTPEAFVGLSPRDLVSQFRHQVLILFKLLLLEKRILFRGASVGPLCSALLTLVSLIPLTLEYGLNQSACVKTSKTLSIVPQFSLDDQSSDTEEEEDQSQISQFPSISKTEEKEKADSQKPSPVFEDKKLTQQEQKIQEKKTKDLINSSRLIQGSVSSRDHPDCSNNLQSALATGIKSNLSNSSLKSIEDSTGEKEKIDIPDFLTAVQMTPKDAGLPLQLFTKGYICHPYLSLHYMDLLSDSRVRGFIVGATNILFKQKKDLADVIVEMDDGGSVEISCPLLKKITTLTTQDLRFADFIVKNVTQDYSNNGNGVAGGGGGPVDNFMDGVGWEGGDEWIRSQFKYYLMCMLRTSLLQDEGQGSFSSNSNKIKDSFGKDFLVELRKTKHWKVWSTYVNSDERDTPGIYLLSPGHPFEGQISMSDMKLRFNHTIQSTEGGRKINQAVGKAVVSTGKAVGGALHQAKGAISSWWTSVTTTPTNTLTSNSTLNNEDSEAAAAASASASSEISQSPVKGKNNGNLSPKPVEPQKVVEMETSFGVNVDEVRQSFSFQ